MTAAKSEDNPHSSNHCVEAHLYTVFGPKVTDKLHAFKNNQNNNLLCMKVSSRIFSLWFTFASYKLFADPVLTPLPLSEFF